MAKIFPGRYTALVSPRITESYVVLFLGVRVNHLFLFWKWIPTVLVAAPMVYSLMRHRAAGFLGAQAFFFQPGVGIIQYWRSFDDLERFARSKKHPHLRGWRWYNRSIGASGSVGLWHEAFLVRPGCQETRYDNMPLFGLGRAAKHVPVSEQQGARLRLGEEASPVELSPSSTTL